MSRIMNSAHEECSGDAACAQGDGPCIAWFRDRIDADTVLLKECREALDCEGDHVLGEHRGLYEECTKAPCEPTRFLLARLNERLEEK